MCCEEQVGGTGWGARAQPELFLSPAPVSEVTLWTNESSGVRPSANHRSGQRLGCVPELRWGM